MHSACELVGNTYNSIAEDSLNVALCNDNAFLDLDLACGTLDSAACGACCIAALSYGSNNADCTCISLGKLYLCCGTAGTED